MAALLATGSTVVTAAPAQAASGVSIKKIAAKTAPYGGKVTISPSTKKKAKTKVISKRLTVKQGSKTIAKNKTSVKLAAGTYSVKTTVKYRTYKLKKVTTSRASGSVTKTKTVKVWSKTKTKNVSQTLVIKAGARPSKTDPYSNGECPSWAPIKGNQGAYDWIYHVPGSTYYSRTSAEECFTTTSAARNAGYRAPLR